MGIMQGVILYICLNVQCAQRHRINLASHFRRATMFVLYLILAVLAFWLLFVTKKPANSPPGPWFRLPLIGHLKRMMPGAPLVVE